MHELEDESFLLVFGASQVCFVRAARTSCEVRSIHDVERPIGGGPCVAKIGCSLGGVESCRWRSRGDAQVTMRGDVGRGGS